jgi:hypothetical protein
MIRVTVELLPAGDEERKRLLGVATIANDGSSLNPSFGNYVVYLSKWAPHQNRTWKAGAVTKFNRRTRGPWDLLYVALRNIVGDRNP